MALCRCKDTGRRRCRIEHSGPDGYHQTARFEAKAARRAAKVALAMGRIA